MTNYNFFFFKSADKFPSSAIHLNHKVMLSMLPAGGISPWTYQKNSSSLVPLWLQILYILAAANFDIFTFNYMRVPPAAYHPPEAVRAARELSHYTNNNASRARRRRPSSRRILFLAIYIGNACGEKRTQDKLAPLGCAFRCGLGTAAFHGRSVIARAFMGGDTFFFLISFFWYGLFGKLERGECTDCNVK